MNLKDFMQNYQDLEQLSDKGTDIYGSELCRDILSPDSYSFDLLNMQLEQEWFSRQMREHTLQGLSDQDKLSHTFHQTVDAYLGEWLAHYDYEDRRGVLLRLLTALEDSSLWTGETLAVAARLPEERLTALAAGAVERHAIKLCAEQVEPENEENAARVHISNSVSATAAALSIAAYAEYPELRASPELIAFTSSAAASAAHVERQKDAWKAAGMGAYMELILAAAVLVEGLEIPVSGVSESEKTGEMENADGLFHLFLALFFRELTLLLGAAAMGIILSAAAILTGLADAAAAEDAEEIAAHTLPAEAAREEAEYGEQEDEEDDTIGAWEFS